MRGSPIDQISQSITAVMRASTASRLPSRKSPCTTDGPMGDGTLGPQRVAGLGPAGDQRGVDGLQGGTPPVDLRGRVDDRLAVQTQVAGATARCSVAIASAACRKRWATCWFGTPSGGSNSGSNDSPSISDITNSGGTSTGAPGSAHSTSGTGTSVGPSAVIIRACRSTSRCAIGSTPGGATLTTTGRSASSPRNVRLDAPPANGRTAETPADRQPVLQRVEVQLSHSANRFRAGTAGCGRCGRSTSSGHRCTA